MLRRERLSGSSSKPDSPSSWRFQLELIYLKLLVLIIVANLAPIVGQRMLGNRFASPLDCGLRFLDGRPLLGPSKTWRGYLFSILITSACAWVEGLDMATGLVFSLAALLGDSVTSLIILDLIFWRYYSPTFLAGYRPVCLAAHHPHQFLHMSNIEQIATYSSGHTAVDSHRLSKTRRRRHRDLPSGSVVPRPLPYGSDLLL